MRILISLLALLCCTQMQALDPCAHWYLAPGAGVNFVHIPRQEGAKVRFNTGYYVGGSVGLHMSRFIRIEGEFAYRSNIVDEIFIDDLPVSSAGHLHEWTGFANFFIGKPCYDDILFPRFGAGVGTQHVHTSGIDTTVWNALPREITHPLDHVGVIFQMMVGLGLEVACHTEVFFDYHYLNGPVTNLTQTLTLSLVQSF